MKQIKTLELWRGLVVHEGIQRFLVPRLQSGQPIDWEEILQATSDLASGQLRFSEKRLYRANGVSKAKHRDEYCALLPHELGRSISPEEMQKVHETIRLSFENLATMAEFLHEITGRRR